MTTTDTRTTDTEVEDVDTFRHRARTFIRENLAPAGTRPSFGEMTDEQELHEMDRHRGLQRQLFDAGLAGIVVPRDYGGQGLTPAHAIAFNQEIAGFDAPTMLQVPNFTPCMAVILEFGTHEQKLRHIPPILRGEHVFVQFLSEPSSASDAAGAQTTATRDGEEWLLNGSKIWTSGAWRADWGLCLARTNWDVEKHRGLSVFLVPVRSEGIELHRIEMLNGSKEFCQEFLTDVRIPDADRIGAVDDGWTVGIRWLYHERSFALSPYILGRAGGAEGSADSLIALARKADRLDDPLARDRIGEVQADSLVAAEASKRISQGMRTGHLNDQGAALSRLLSGVNRHPSQHGGFRAGRRGRRGLVRRRRGSRAGWYRVPLPPSRSDRWRHHGDGSQRHQRAGPGHAPRAGG